MVSGSCSFELCDANSEIFNTSALKTFVKHQNVAVERNFYAFRSCLKLLHFLLANALAMTTLRVLEPSCSLPSSWSHESLNTAVSRVINGLYRLCTGPLENGDANHDAIHKEAELTVSDVCFAFPLIQLVVQDGQSKSFTVKEDVTLDAFRVLCKILEVCAGDVQDQLSNGFEEDDTAIMEVEEVCEGWLV